jgi:hypothetical protein
MPSGTLIVVGPMELVEDEWDRSVERLQMACTLAELSGHRVVIIAETPTPEDLCEDMWLMARTGEHEGVNYSLAMRGVITHEGDLALRVPFAKPWPRIESPRSIATPDAIPTEARELITKALQGRKSGLLIFGGDAVREHWAADLVDAGLALTEHAGPAARIMPRTRGTPAKNFWVPEATRQLPYLPSIESAYDRGFRRMLIDPHATDGETLRKYAGKAIFIAGTHGYEARGIVLSGIRGVSFDKEMEMHSHIIGLLGVARLPSRNGIRAICDLFIGAGESPPGLERGAELYDFVSQNRVLKWEDQVEQLLGRGEIAMADLKDMQIQPPTLARFAQQIGKHFAGPSTTQ